VFKNKVNNIIKCVPDCNYSCFNDIHYTMVFHSDYYLIYCMHSIPNKFIKTLITYLICNSQYDLSIILYSSILQQLEDTKGIQL